MGEVKRMRKRSLKAKTLRYRLRGWFRRGCFELANQAYEIAELSMR